MDETGSDRRNLVTKYGYSIRGKPARVQRFLTRGERISAIACMSASGLLDVKTVKGTTDCADFYSFVQKYLLPHLMPYNGVNPHSVVVKTSYGCTTKGPTIEAPVCIRYFCIF